MSVFELDCPKNCSLRPGTPWSDFVSSRLANRVPQRAIVRAAAAEGFKLSAGTLARHVKHMRDPNAPLEPEPGVKVNNIEILEAIIQKGFRNQKNWRPTISDTMKAMDMWFKLTQGNPFEEFLDSLATAALDTGDGAAGTAEETEPEDDPEG